MTTEKRLLKIREDLLDTVHPRVLPFNGQIVTVLSWHDLVSKNMKKLFPDDDTVGFVEEFYLDIPESELIEAYHAKT